MDKALNLANDIGATGREGPEFYFASLNRLVRENMNIALRPFGLKLADWRLLQCMQRSANLSIADLADLAVIERSVASRLVDKLVSKGLARKQVDKADRRFSVISISKAGCKKLAESEHVVNDLRVQMFDGLNAEEYENLLQVLQKIRRNAKGYDRLR